MTVMELHNELIKKQIENENLRYKVYKTLEVEDGRHAG